MSYKHPALSWLIKHDSEAALAVFHKLRDEFYAHGDTDHPRRPDPTPDDLDTHMVPDTLYGGGTLCEEAGSCDEINPEFLHEETPDLNSLLRSAGGVAWPWCGRRVRRDRKWVWAGEPWQYRFPVAPLLSGPHLIELAGLTFYTKPGARRGAAGGFLLSFRDDDNNVRRPSYIAVKPRGGKRPHRADATAYLGIKPTTASPLAAHHLHRPLSGGRAIGNFYDPLPREEPGAANRLGRYGVEEARALLEQFRVDGSVPFSDLPTASSKYPDAIAKGARFVGGISGAKHTASTPAPAWQERDTSTSSPVLEEVGARGTLASIGIKLGYRGGYADRAGKKALLAVGRDLVAANQNVAKKLAA